MKMRDTVILPSLYAVHSARSGGSASKTPLSYLGLSGRKQGGVELRKLRYGTEEKFEHVAAGNGVSALPLSTANTSPD
jgi:hypothetical protein